jgi:hypothetical protein
MEKLLVLVSFRSQINLNKNIKIKIFSRKIRAHQVEATELCFVENLETLRRRLRWIFGH